MKWLTAVLTFVNLSVISGLFLGMAGRGLNTLTAALALICGAAFAVAAFLGTSDPAGYEKTANPSERKPGNATESKPTPIRSALMRYRRVWFWLMAACFAVFAVRSFRCRRCRTTSKRIGRQTRRSTRPLARTTHGGTA